MVFSLGPGEIGGPVRVGDAWYLVTVRDVREAQLEDLNEPATRKEERRKYIHARMDAYTINLRTNDFTVIGVDMLKYVFYSLLVALLSFNVAASDDYLSPGLTPAELQAKLDTTGAPRVVDVRKPVEFGVGHVPGAVNIPLEELEERLEEVRHDNGVLIYCINGSRTRQAESILYTHDIDNVYHLEGAFYAWIRGKNPIEKGGVKKSGW